MFDSGRVKTINIPRSLEQKMLWDKNYLQKDKAKFISNQLGPHFSPKSSYCIETLFFVMDDIATVQPKLTVFLGFL